MNDPYSQVVYTRDRHPAGHCTLSEQGGRMPAHWVEASPGFAIHAELPVLGGSLIVDKGMAASRDTHGAFDGTDLAAVLRSRYINRCVVAGLTTDYCVKATVLGALRAGIQTSLVVDAIGARNLRPGDGDRAVLEMRQAGAFLTDTGQIATIVHFYRQPTALLIIDMQNDFFPGGALPIADAPRVVAAIRQLLHAARIGGHWESPI